MTEMNNLTFPEMPYERPDLDTLKAEMRACTERLKEASSYEEARKAFLDSEALGRRVSTLANLASIRHSIDTRDKFYDGEETFWMKASPELEELSDSFREGMLNSPFKAQFEEEYGSIVFINMELQKKAFSPEIVPQMQKENETVQAYEKLLASAQIPFEGGV